MSTQASFAAVVPIGPIAEVLVVVADLDDAVRRYVDGFGWSVREGAGRWGRRCAAGWRAPALEDARTARVGPTGPAGAPGAVRLVEWPAVVPPEPLRSFGWTAIEVCVRDVDAAVDRALRSGWTLLRRPARLGGGKLPLVAGQVAGPDGEAVYLTQLLSDVPGFELPAARQDVDGVFIAVLGVPDLVAARSVLERRFAVRRASDRRSPIGVLNAVFGLADETLHRLSTLQLEGRTCIEIDELPARAAARRRPSGYLPGGVAGVLVETRAARGDLVDLPGGALLRVEPGAGERSDDNRPGDTETDNWQQPTTLS